MPFKELRASGGASGQVGRDLAPHVSKAVKGMKDAAEGLRDWSFGTALEYAASEWDTALEGMRTRIGRSGELLTDTANGQQWTDSRIYDSFLKGYER
ncbi:hypothetical protein [Streptomyces luteireticuli]|uniref:hypothetical protein n=1 Tax=Streptomyces luteireticuli TaxID=173858 RepID=UPI003555D2DE